MTATLASPARGNAGSADDSATAASLIVSGDAVGSAEGNSDVDFYGNEVSAAVARYKVDPSGLVYEEHSPETEVPRLGSPKS